MAGAPFDDRDGYIWYNGDLVEWRAAQTHVLNHGLHYASSVFEGQRAYNGTIFKLAEHTERLRLSAQMMGFDIPYSDQDINEACYRVLEANGTPNAYVRPVAWRGSEQMAISSQRTRIHVAIAAWEMGKYFDPEALMQGIKLKTSPWHRPSPDCAPVHAKAAGLYMICTLSKHAAEAEGFHDALMLDYRGRVAEATGANIFLVQDGALHTPIPDCFLDGITRRTVIALARQRGLEVVERPVWPEDLDQAEEVFIVGTAAEVTPIGQIDARTYQPGQITRLIMDAYADTVRDAEAHEQIVLAPAAQ